MSSNGNPMIVPPDLAKLGFVSYTAPTLKPRVIVCSLAKEKTGKTSWGFRPEGLPEPFGVVSTDNRTIDIADEWAGRRRFMLNHFVMPEKSSDKEKNKERFGVLWEKIQDSWYRLLDHGRKGNIRGIMWDTATQGYEIARLAHFGKLEQVKSHHYGPLNQEFRELMEALKAVKGLNAILIHKVKKEYRAKRSSGEGSDDTVWTGRWERSGFGDMPYLCDVTIEHRFNRQSGQFEIEVLDSGINLVESVGEILSGDFCSFVGLANLLYGDKVASSYWE